MNTPRVAFVSVGLYGHGHNLSFAPNAILMIADAVYHHFGDRVTCRVFDEVLLGYEDMLRQIRACSPTALLVSVQVSGYYGEAIRLLTDLPEIPRENILFGGYHFTVENIASLAARMRGVAVCYGKGRTTAVRFIEHLLNPHSSITEVPGICVRGAGGHVHCTLPVNEVWYTDRYPALPTAVFDPRPYWHDPLQHSAEHLRHIDSIGGVEIGRTIVGPTVVGGCTYRAARMRTGRTSCEYCTLTNDLHRAPSSVYWDLMRQLYDYVSSVPYEGPPGIRVYHTGDDLASDAVFVRQIWKTRPDWFSDAPIGQRAYAWYVSEAQAKMLHDLKIKWLYIGADGKEGWTSDYSCNHPLVRTLLNLRTYDLKAHVGCVLGTLDQTWADITAWQSFMLQVRSQFADVVFSSDAWVQVVAPGSPNWRLLVDEFPEFAMTDNPDLEAVRMRFWEHFTKLGSDGEMVRRRLYEISESVSHNSQRVFMLRS